MADKLTYRDSGVDIDAGNQFVENIKKSVQSTYIDGVLGDIGGFGGLFELAKYKNPVLVSGTDGVGTKLKIAFMVDKHDTIGIDAVAMCVNDIAVLGAKPLFFLDYLATGRLDPKVSPDIVSGIAEGCRQAGCALIGGETAEMPGFYQVGEYDIAGFSVGIVEKDEIINGSTTKEGDIIIGLPSSGIHSNGYSLVRKLFFEKLSWTVDTYVDELGKKLGEELITPTRIYVKTVLSLKEKVNIKGMVHVTGGGFIENIPRVLPEDLDAVIDLNSYNVPAIFKLMQKHGNIDTHEMYKTFNMGIGYIFIVSKDEKDKAIETLKELGETPVILGEVVKGTRKCLLK
ncbi:MAG: phosphoribosylformylglycinamidine cyclo-ligase [Fusobacteria bacterium]|nr:phosphoribosylformylglycinamidine cyclo-ligase [Fusobacteriota bacterium]